MHVHAPAVALLTRLLRCRCPSSLLLHSSLYFYCNRPTVAALITMGVDVGAAASAAFSGEEAPPTAGSSGGGEAGAGAGEREACKVEGEAGVAGQAAALEQGAPQGAAAQETLDQVRL